MKNTFLRRLLPLMMAALLMIPAAAWALENTDIQYASGGAVYSFTNNLLTVKSGDVVVKVPNTEGAANFNILVLGGKLDVKGNVVGSVTVEDGYLKIIEINSSSEAALKGTLNVSGGEVYIEGRSIQDGIPGSTPGLCLTGDSEISGGTVRIYGGNDPNGGSPALVRRNGATMTVSNVSFEEDGGLDLCGGIYQSAGWDTDFYPDRAKKPAVEEPAMLVWSSPVQLMTGEYDGNRYAFKDWETAYKQEDLSGKPVIRSFKGWTVTYDANGGTGTMPMDVVPDNQPYNVATCTFTPPAHHSFLNWIVKMGGAEQKENSFPVTADVLVTANWKEEPKYTITFETDGGSAVDPIIDYAGEAVTKPADPTKEGHTFAGWDAAIPATMPAENLTIKATWTKNQYTITFVDEDGNELDEITGDYGDPIAPPADPTKEGYTFAGWDGLPATIPAENLTIKAIWTKNGENPDQPETLYRPGQYGIDKANHSSLPYKTAAELKDALRKKMADMGFVAEGEQFFDVILEKSVDGGLTWVEVPTDEFPAAGYRVVFKYPEGTNKDEFVFKVVHMFSMTDTRLNIIAGDMETPDVEQTDEGIVVMLKGFSPVMLQWQKKPSAAGLPQTGDPSSLLGWAALLCASGLGMKMIKRRK